MTKNRWVAGTDPDDHAIGRFRGGLTTKTHELVDGRGPTVARGPQRWSPSATRSSRSTRCMRSATGTITSSQEIRPTTADRCPPSGGGRTTAGERPLTA